MSEQKDNEIESEQQFDPQLYYSSYPARVILRPGYTARAQYKSTLLWKLYGHTIRNSLGSIRSYADIGGCFGFGANAMAFQISKSQGEYPETKVFEISPDFITIGKQLFPYIDFIQKDFCLWNGPPKVFDLITMFDVIEHIEKPMSFLSKAANHFRYALLKTPLETGGDWFGAKPPIKQGNEHEDGHINFFTPKAYLELLDRSGLEVIMGRFVPTIVPANTEEILTPEDLSQSKLSIKRKGRILIKKLLPNYFIRKIFGGAIIYA